MKKPDEPEVFELLRRLRYDLTAAQAKVTDALNMLADLDLPSPVAKPECPKCGLEVSALALHLQNVHGGPPVPLSAAEAAS